MVEYSRLIVNDHQIKVNDYFLNFKIISIGKIRNNKVNIHLIRFGKRKLYSTVLYITQGIPAMNPRNIITIYDITVVNSNKRKR